MQSSKVFLNPDFKNTHINPKFLISKLSSTIHVNPNFLQKLEPNVSQENYSENYFHTPVKITSQNQNLPVIKTGIANTTGQSKIISKSRTKIIRASVNLRPQISAPLTAISRSDVNTSLIKIGKNKLIRKTTVVPINEQSKRSIKNTFKKINVVPMVKGRYKVDRRTIKATIGTLKTSPKKQAFVSRYALYRVILRENLPVTKVLITQRNLLRIGSSSSVNLPSSTKKQSTRSVNKKLEMLNINGVLYKSTRNKLQKTGTDMHSVRSVENKNSNGKRSIYIRGDKFVLDKSGHSLTRIGSKTQDNKTTRLKRIDIGGLTYVAKSQNIFVRTDIHKARNHLSLAKQKSINVLSKKLVKSNVPCPIFRKVGKCAAYERGRCPKVHDRIHVNICSKFLKGECNNENCLLSHEVTLSKMPTCKFFLQGCCVRDDCPYLHKKLNEKTEICLDFLKGFCHLAEKCNKRHEFLCPDFESTGKCEKPKCPYCRKKDKKLVTKKKTDAIKKAKKNYEIQLSPIRQEEKLDVRYFSDEAATKIINGENVSNTENYNSVENNYNDDEIVNEDEEYMESNSLLKRRPKLGDLPAFIPL